MDGVTAQNCVGVVRLEGFSAQLGHLLFNLAGKNSLGLVEVIWTVSGEFPPKKTLRQHSVNTSHLSSQ